MKDLFAEQPYGKAALAQLAPLPENFRLYKAEWLGSNPKDWKVMKVEGAVFRRAKRGKNAGKLTVMVPGTKLTVYVHVSEMKEFE